MKTVTEKARRAAAAFVREGNALIERESIAGAINAFRKALDLVPAHDEAAFNLGVALAEAGKTDEAAAAFRSLAESKPDLAATHAALAAALDAHRIDRFEPGMTLTATDALDAAIADYRIAMDSIPMLYGCQKAIADLMMAEGQLAEADAAITAAEQYSSALPDAMNDVGATMQHPGRLADALERHRQAMAMYPDHEHMTEDDYLSTDLTFTRDEILLPDGFEVMMEWERPIMERSAEIVCHNHGDVLNVGFGMAIIDTAIQKQGITTHTIIEAHPQVIEKAKRWAEDKKGVRLVHSIWQDALNDLPPLDGIYFDTLMPPMIPFLERVPDLLKPGGIFLYVQSMVHFENLEAMAGNGLRLGIEFLPFDHIPENAYYRLNEKTVDGRYSAPLFVYQKPEE
ncbi:MAG: tetratricopeptide repeat protein [Pseudomonadota bacterium]